MNKQHDHVVFIVNKDLLEEFSREPLEIIEIEQSSNTLAHFHNVIDNNTRE
jgi:hypothetical protein